MILFATILALGVQSATPAMPATDAKPVKEKKICRKIPVMGSNLPNLECHTAAEWKGIDDAGRPDMTEVQRFQNQGQLVNKPQ